VSQVRKYVLLTINPELIHATLEAIRYSRRTVRGICAAPGYREKEKETGKKKKKKKKREGMTERERESERESEKCVIS